jgi:hypothetical protein
VKIKRSTLSPEDHNLIETEIQTAKCFADNFEQVMRREVEKEEWREVVARIRSEKPEFCSKIEAAADSGMTQKKIPIVRCEDNYVLRAANRINTSDFTYSRRKNGVDGAKPSESGD